MEIEPETSKINRFEYFSTFNFDQTQGVVAMFSNCESLELSCYKQNLKMEIEPETAKFNVLNVSQSFLKTATAS